MNHSYLNYLMYPKNHFLLRYLMNPRCHLLKYQKIRQYLMSH